MADRYADTTGYVPAIDGLRAVAVVAVVAFHFWPKLVPGGYLGVDVFFAISGFVVMSSVSRSAASPTALEFVARRFRRILPALVVCVVISEALAVLLLPTVWLTAPTERYGLRALVGLSNRALVTAGGYFGVSADLNPFTHTWSLAVEEQFYVTFLLVLVLWRWGGRWRNAATAIVILSAILTLAHARTLVHAGRQTLAFYSLSSRLWQIAAGVLLWQFAIVASRRLRPIGTLAAVVGLVVLFLNGTSSGAVWPLGVVAVVLTCVALVCVVPDPERDDMKRLLGAKPLVALGRRSYSLYLWHWPVLVFERWTVGTGGPVRTLLLVTATAVLAEVSFRYVERPVRRSRSIARRPAWLVVVAGVAVLAIGVGATSVMIDHKPQLALTKVIRNRTDWVVFDMPLKTTGKCGLQIRPDSAAPPGAATIRRVGCASNGSDTLFVVGDSHAGAYVGMVSQFTLTTGVPVELISTAGCSFMLELPEAKTPACDDATRATLAFLLKQANAGDVVFMPSSRIHPLTFQDTPLDVTSVLADPRSVATKSPGDRGEETAETRLAPLAAKGVELLWGAPVPVFPAPPFRCADWFSRRNPICAHGLTVSKPVLEQYRAPVVAAMERINTMLGSSTWDPFPVLCPRNPCSAYDGSHPISFDGLHVTAYANRLLVPSFVSRLNQLLNTRAEA